MALQGFPLLRFIFDAIPALEIAFSPLQRVAACPGMGAMLVIDAFTLRMYCSLESAGLDLSLRIVTFFFSFGEVRLAMGVWY